MYKPLPTMTDRFNTLNLRPIFNLPTSSKLVDKAVSIQLILERNGLIGDENIGFGQVSVRLILPNICLYADDVNLNIFKKCLDEN